MVSEAPKKQCELFDGLCIMLINGDKTALTPVDRGRLSRAKEMRGGMQGRRITRMLRPTLEAGNQGKIHV